VEQEALWFQTKHLHHKGGGCKFAHYIVTPCNNAIKHENFSKDQLYRDADKSLV